MTDFQSDRATTWATIAIFIAILAGLSSICYFAILRLNPTSIYVGALMWCPAIAALITLRIRGRSLSSLPWKWGAWRYNIWAYLLPVAYIATAYFLVWGIGFGAVFNLENIAEWSDELGLPQTEPIITMIVMIALLATVQFIKSLGSIVGEEVGWRGFLVWELHKVLPFGGVSILSGLIWALWHYPIVIAFGGGDPLFQIACFTLMIISMSVIMTYFTFKSGSLWPAVVFHAAHNIYIQKIFTPLTIRSENSEMWIDEYGLMIPFVVTCLAFFFWRKAKAENL